MSKKHVFLSYCHDNREEAAQLRAELIAAGETVWWDQDIPLGNDWEQEIRQAMAASYAVVVCLSKELDGRHESGVYPEIHEAIKAYRKRKSGTAFIFIVRLSECEIPDIAIDSLRQLDSLQHVELFPVSQRADGLARLIDAFRKAPDRPDVDPTEDDAGGHKYAPVRKKVFLSSSLTQHLPALRKPMEDACLRMDCAPLSSEIDLPIDQPSLDAWLAQMDGADIYVGVFAHQYGKPLAGQPLSLIELEYNRAGEHPKKIPRLVFLQDEEVPVPPKEVDKGPGAEKLQRFKERIASDGCKVAEFKDVADLRAKVIEALKRFREPRPASFHYVSDIPAPPEVYVAHPYTLLQTGRLVGRQEELNWLTDWVAKRGSPPYASRMFFLVAIGGQGKSALTWHWFQTIAEQEMQPLAGRMWWSFYESDASFENFVMRALAYVTRRPLDEIRQLPPAEREDRLLRVLDHEPYLMVLDGLERVLLAYSGADFSRLQDDELDQQTANYVVRAYGLPETAAQSFTGQHRLRLTADPRVGAFLRKLTQVKAARILVSTRLYPTELQLPNREPARGCCAYFLTGLSDADALELWRGFGAKGSRETLLPMFATFDKHPLLIQALASVVAHDRRAVGDFDTWHKHHPDFDPFPLLHATQRKSHVLSHALRGLDEQQRRLLQTIAAFRLPTSYETLVALFVRPSFNGKPQASADPTASETEEDVRDADAFGLPLDEGNSSATFDSEPALDAALTTLEDRGLLGWDRRGNRYDLHPIVQGVVWSELDADRRRDICDTLHEHFAPIEVPGFENVENLDDLTPAIELFHTLIELERYEDALRVFRDRLSKATLWRLSASRVRIELVERLFPDGLDHPPRLSAPQDQSYTLNALAQAYQLSGLPGAAVPVFRRAREVDEREKEKDRGELSVGLCNLSNAERLSGDVRSAEASARAALRITREKRHEFQEAVSLYWLGLALAVRSANLECGDSSPLFPSGESDLSAASQPPPDPRKNRKAATSRRTPNDALAALERSLHRHHRQHDQTGEGLVNAYLAEVALWLGDAATARTRADRARELAAVQRFEADFIRAARLQGTAALRSLTLRVEPDGSANFQPLDSESQATVDFIHERLHHALTRARACQLVEEELPTLIALAELHHAFACRTPDQPLRDSVRFSGVEREPHASAWRLMELTPDDLLVEARRFLDDVWDRAERGPYPLLHADACNLLAQIERTTAALAPPDSDVAREALARARDAALSAYRLAWLQGPPFAYAYGLYHAEQHLQALGIAPPDLPPYDESKYDPMPNVPIIPPA